MRVAGRLFEQWSQSGLCLMMRGPASSASALGYVAESKLHKLN
jgi:hypothetical protein